PYLVQTVLGKSSVASAVKAVGSAGSEATTDEDESGDLKGILEMKFSKSLRGRVEARRRHHQRAERKKEKKMSRKSEVVFVMTREGHRRGGVRVPLWVRILLCIGIGIIIILSRVKLVSSPEFESIHSAPLVGVNVNYLFTDKYLSGRAWGTYIPQLLFALTPGHSQWEGDDPGRAPVVGLLWSDVNGKNLRYECEVPGSAWQKGDAIE
ncbi:WD repeat-containing protein 19, partial [Perkinsus olseni]